MNIEKHISIAKLQSSISEISDESNYAVLWVKYGVEALHIDFNCFSMEENAIYFITPGRKVRPIYANKPCGWVLRFSKEFFNHHIRDNLIIKDVDIFATFGDTPKIILSPKIGNRIHLLTEMIDELLGSEIPNRESAIASLLKTLLIYCDSKCNIRIVQENNTTQVQLVSTFKDLISEHYTHLHKVSEYARLMNISPKYLNQVVKQVLGVTAKSIIQEQLIIQSRRELKFSNSSIKEIAFKLGFSEPFHFSNFFKNFTGIPPSKYRHL